MTYRDQFLQLALETEVFGIHGDRVKFDPLFGGKTGLLQLAARACQEQMEKAPFYEARALFSFDHPGYPLLTVAALEFQGGDARSFINHANHRDYSRDLLEDKRVIIFATTEAEVELYGAEGYLKKYGATVAGALIFYSPEFIQEQNERITFPVARIISDQDIFDQFPIDTDRHDYLLPG